MGKIRPVNRRLNRFAVVFDTLLATHDCTELALLKSLGMRRNEKALRSIQSWRAGKTKPRAGKYLNLLEKIEAKLEVPAGRLANLSGGRSSVFYRILSKHNPAHQQLIRWHMPTDFDMRPEGERQEIMAWISANVLPCGTAFGKYQSKVSGARFAVVFPSLPRSLGGRTWMGHRLKNRELVRKFKEHGTVPAPPRLTREISQIIAFHTALLPPKSFRRRKKWSRATALTTTARIGSVLGALAAPPDRNVKGLGVPVAHLTIALFVFPDIWEWYLHWSERRRGFYSNTERSVLYDVKLLTRKPTGWIRQYPRLARRLKPIEGLLSQKDINRARTNWGATCDKAFEYASGRLLELAGVVRMHRDPFLPILPVLTNDSPLREYKKIGDEILRHMDDERIRPMSSRSACSERRPGDSSA
jgi:hypothetical protein